MRYKSRIKIICGSWFSHRSWNHIVGMHPGFHNIWDMWCCGCRGKTNNYSITGCIRGRLYQCCELGIFCFFGTYKWQLSRFWQWINDGEGTLWIAWVPEKFESKCHWWNQSPQYRTCDWKIWVCSEFHSYAYRFYGNHFIFSCRKWICCSPANIYGVSSLVCLFARYLRLSYPHFHPINCPSDISRLESVFWCPFWLIRTGMTQFLGYFLVLIEFDGLFWYRYHICSLDPSHNSFVHCDLLWHVDLERWSLSFEYHFIWHTQLK